MEQIQRNPKAESELLPLIDSKPQPQEKKCLFPTSYLRTVGTLSCLSLSVGLFALAILRDYGNAYNALVTTSIGLTFQASLQLLPCRINTDTNALTLYGRFVNYEKDKVLKYSAIYYFCMTQLFLNITQTRAIQRGFYGSFNFLLGVLFMTLVDTIANWKLKDARIPDPTATSINLNDMGEDPSFSTLPPYSKTIKILPIDKEKRDAKAKEKRLRIITDLAKLALATSTIIGFSVAKSYAPDSWAGKSAAIPLKFANILLGHALGCLGHEVIHAIHELVREKNPPKVQNQGAFGNPTVYTPFPVKLMMGIEKVERAVGVLFPGIVIAFYTYTAGKTISAPDIIAGALMGIVRQIDLIHFTQNPADRLELGDKTTPMNKYLWVAEKVAKWGFAIVIIGGFLGLGIYQGITQGPPINAYTLGTVAVVLYPAYALAKWVGTQKIDENSHPFLNTLYFYTNYSIAAPIIYIAVTQVLKIGDIALDSYGVGKSITACLGWAYLAWAFGVQAGSRNTQSYPADVDPLIILFTFFFVQQLTGQAPS